MHPLKHLFPPPSHTHTLTHPISPLQDGFLFQDIIVIESFEDVRYTRQEFRVHLPHQDFKCSQEVFLALAVVQDKLRGGGWCVCVCVCEVQYMRVNKEANKLMTCQTII